MRQALPPDMVGAFSGASQISPAVLQTIIAESLGEGPEGMRLVAETIINRARDRGITPEEVVMERGQYAPHSPQYEAGSAIDLDDPDNIAAATAAWGAAQSAEDPTMGAEFFSVTGTRAPTATERLQPVWEHGKHTFWNDTSGIKVMQQNLAAAGLYDGSIDGDFGPATKAAADAFRAQLGTDDPMQALTSLGVEPAVGQQAIQNILQSPESLPPASYGPDLSGMSERMRGAIRGGPDEPAVGADIMRREAERLAGHTPLYGGQEVVDAAQAGAVPAPVPPPASGAGVDATGAPVDYAGDYNDILDAGAAVPQPPAAPAPAALADEMAARQPPRRDRSDLTQAGPRYDPLNPVSAATPPPMASVDPYADFETTRANVQSPQTLRDMMGQAGLDDSQWNAGALGLPQAPQSPDLAPLMQQQYEQEALRDWARPQAPAPITPQSPLGDPRLEQMQEQQGRTFAPYNAEAEAAAAQATHQRLLDEGLDPQAAWNEMQRELGTIAGTQPIGPPESRNYRIGQGLRPDAEALQTAAIGGPDAPPPMMTGGPPAPGETPVVDIGLTAMPPDMSWSDLVSSGGLTPQQIDSLQQQQANPPAPRPVTPIYHAPAGVTGTHDEVAATTAQTVSAVAGGNVSAADALDLARSIEGNSEIEPQGRALISQYLQTGGIGMDPKVTPWCAAMVNASLAQVGIEGSGSMAASSFAEWGDAVEPSDVQKGDVLYKMGTAKNVGDPGGHVGFATGQTRMENGVLQYEMYGGNQTTDTSGERGVTANVKWVDASEFNPRRAPVEAQQVAAATTAAAAQALGDVSAQTTEQTMLSTVDNSGQLLTMAQAADDAGANNIEAVGGTVRVWQDAARTIPGSEEQSAAIAAAGGPGVSIDYGQPGVLNVAAAGPAATTSATTAADARVGTAVQPPLAEAVPITPAPAAPTSYTPFTPAPVSAPAVTAAPVPPDMGGRPNAAQMTIDTPLGTGAATNPYSSAGNVAADIGAGIPPMNQPPSDPYAAAEEAVTGAGEALREGVNTAASGGYRYGAGYEPAAAGAAGTAAVPPPAATAAVAPPAATAGQVVSEGPARVQLTAPAGTQYNTMEGPVVGIGAPVLDTGARTTPAMTGKERDDYIGSVAMGEPSVPISDIPPEMGPTPDKFTSNAPATGPIMVTPVGTPAPAYPTAPAPAPVPAPVAPQQLPVTPNVTPSVAVPATTVAPVPEKPSFQERTEKAGGRSKRFSDPIEYAARNSVTDDGKFDHDKFWDQLGDVDLTQTQQTQAARTAAQGHFQANKLPGFLPNIGMPNMSGVGNVLGGVGDAVQGAVGNIPNPISALGNVFGSLFGGQTPYSGGGPTGSGAYGYSSPNNYVPGAMGPPGSSGNYGGNYSGPGSYQGGGGSQYGGGFGAGGGFLGGGTYGGIGGANISQGVGGAFRNR